MPYALSITCEAVHLALCLLESGVNAVDSI
jgi:hypothetical protein